MMFKSTSPALPDAPLLAVIHTSHTLGYTGYILGPDFDDRNPLFFTKKFQNNQTISENNRSGNDVLN